MGVPRSRALSFLAVAGVAFLLSGCVDTPAVSLDRKASMRFWNPHASAFPDVELRATVKPEILGVESPFPVVPESTRVSIEGGRGLPPPGALLRYGVWEDHPEEHRFLGFLSLEYEGWRFHDVVRPPLRWSSIVVTIEAEDHPTGHVVLFRGSQPMRGTLLFSHVTGGLSVAENETGWSMRVSAEHLGDHLCERRREGETCDEKAKEFEFCAWREPLSSMPRRAHLVGCWESIHGGALNSTGTGPLGDFRFQITLENRAWKTREDPGGIVVIERTVRATPEDDFYFALT